MHQEFNIGIKTLCGLFGKTRHTYYDHEWNLKAQTAEYAIILKLVEEQRRLMPRAGIPKMLSLPVTCHFAETLEGIQAREETG